MTLNLSEEFLKQRWQLLTDEPTIKITLDTDTSKYVQAVSDVMSVIAEHATLWKTSSVEVSASTNKNKLLSGRDFVVNSEEHNEIFAILNGEIKASELYDILKALDRLTAKNKFSISEHESLPAADTTEELIKSGDYLVDVLNVSFDGDLVTITYVQNLSLINKLKVVKPMDFIYLDMQNGITSNLLDKKGDYIIPGTDLTCHRVIEVDKANERLLITRPINLNSKTDLENVMDEYLSNEGYYQTHFDKVVNVVQNIHKIKI